MPVFIFSPLRILSSKVYPGPVHPILKQVNSAVYLSMSPSDRTLWNHPLPSMFIRSFPCLLGGIGGGREEGVSVLNAAAAINRETSKREGGGRRKETDPLSLFRSQLWLFPYLPTSNLHVGSAPFREITHLLMCALSDWKMAPDGC